MQNIPSVLSRTIWGCAAALVLTAVTGCESADTAKTTPAPAASTAPAKPATNAAPAVTTPAPTPAAPAATAPAAAKPAAATPAAAAPGVIRIKAGASAPFKDSAGNVWAAETGFEGGSTIDRDAGTSIGNTKDAGLYLSEHYGMDSFSCALPNGKYVAKLYFAETYDGVSGAGGRVFTFNVQGKEFKDFDVFVKAGGSNKAYVETVPVEVKDGKFKITFTTNVENPEINAIEITPQ
jgi:hypothetical protein